MTDVNEQNARSTTPESQPTNTEERSESTEQFSPSTLAAPEEPGHEVHNAPVESTQSVVPPEQSQETLAEPSSQDNSNISTPITAKPNISNIDGVFTNMQLTSTYPKEMTKVVTTTNSSSQDDILPKYEDVAHLSPPKYADLFRNNPSLISSLDFNEVELNGLIIGGYEVFFGFCTLTLIFNIVGFFVSMLLSDSYAGKYGACFGLGLLIVLSGIFNFPFTLHHQQGNIGKSRDVWGRTLSIVFISVGTLTCILCFALYRRIRSEVTRYTEIGVPV